MTTIWKTNNGIRILCAVIAFIVSPRAFAQDNYVISVEPLDAVSNISFTEGAVVQSGSARLAIGRTYYDGIGRQQQSVMQEASPSQSDIVAFLEYDGMDRVVKRWKPVSTGNSGGGYSSYDRLVETEQDYYADVRAYQQTGFEASALGRAISVQKPGSAWYGHPATSSYVSNTGGEVKKYTISGNGELTCISYYNPTSLFVTVNTDEDNKTTSVYTDVFGRTVMTKTYNASTYYVYDDAGRLAYVLPPLAADQLNSGTWSDNNLILKKYAYVYKYDEYGRLRSKRLPGADEQKFISNAAGNVILSQDGNQRNRGNYWTAYQYDQYGRMVYKAEMRLPNGEQDLIRSQQAETSVAAALNVSGNDGTGYSTALFNPISVKMLVVNYYDNYDFLQLLPQEDAAELAYQSETTSSFANAIGMQTGMRVYNLSDNTFTSSAYYYDVDGRLVQNHSTNAFGGSNHTTTSYSFSGKPLVVQTNAVAQGITTAESYQYTYDHADRLLTTTYTYNNDPAVLLQDFRYNESGLLAKKKILNQIDSIVYFYNIQDDITQIQSSGFREDLYYSNPVSPGASPLYNGNISASTWTYGAQVNGYTYSYDSYNRLSSANTIPHEGLSASLYSESFQYDKQGNITYLSRWNNEDAVNGLTFTYYGNQLSKVTDAHHYPTTYGEKRYFDNANFSDDMYYDKNGNLRTDFDRNICIIRYNVLNLPDTIQFSNGDQIVHMYDALGTRLQTIYYTRKTKLYTPPMGPITNTDNLQLYNKTSQATNGNCKFIREGNGNWRLDYVFNPEGYMRYYGPEEHYAFYYIKDHLGNVREVYVYPWANYKECVQRTQYYPSGLPWKESIVPAEQPYKYGGKEFVEMHGLDEYDSDARWYYPAIMRTTTMDPLCEKYYSVSPYAWCGNDPVNLVDPDGRGVFWCDGVEIGNDGNEDDKIYWIKTMDTPYITEEGYVPGAGLGIEDYDATIQFIKENNGNTSAFSKDCIAYKNSVDILVYSEQLRRQMVDAVGDDGSGDCTEANYREYFGSASPYLGYVLNIEKGEVGNLNAPTCETMAGWIDFHSHWSCSIVPVCPWPSLNDINSIYNSSKAFGKDLIGFVFGMSNKTVYLYNQHGVQATCPYDLFVTPSK